MIVKAMQLGQFGTNCYILGDGQAKVCAIIDPGDQASRVINQVEKLGAKVKYILLTHGHFDHLMAVPELRKAYPGAPIYIHQSDVSDTGSETNLSMPPAEGQLFWKDGDKLTLGSLTIEVMHTPGHSPGSVVLKVGDTLFTGDTLFRGSMGRVDFPGGDYKQIMASLRRLAQLPGDYKVYPGHEHSTTLQRERKTNYFMMEAMES